jgi:hypothetical protein
LKEIKMLWPSTINNPTKLDALVSIGTGIQAKEIHFPNVAKIGGLDAVCKTFFNKIDTETSWKEFRQELQGSPLLPKIHRLNVPIDEPYVGLDHYREMGRLANLVEAHYYNADSTTFATEISEVADRLTAALLFFEPDTKISIEDSRHLQPRRGMHALQGTIRCRLSRHSDSLASLARNIEGFYHRHTIGNDRDMYSSMPWTAIELTNAQREAVRVKGAWLRIPFKVETEDQNSVHTIAVRLTVRKRDRKLPPGVTECIPISGFPIKFKELEEKAREKWDVGG